jgi:glycosyltransferase involved in cell wall biosynthesis
VLEPSDGGVAIYVRDLSRELIARGHRVDAVVSDRPGLPSTLREFGMGVAQVPFRAEITELGADLRVLRRLCRILSSRRWDVVHTHGNKAGVLARPLAHAFGMPVVHSPHGFAYLTQRQRPRRGVETRRRVTAGLERLLAPCADRIICASTYDRENALRDGIGQPGQLRIIYNGVVEPAKAPPDPVLTGLAGEGPLVGFLARLHEGKGPIEFLEAIARVRRAGKSVRAVVVGSGPLESEVVETAAALGLDDVPVLPFNGDPFQSLAAFDLYVLPSRWEVFGLTIAEAMAVSVPVIATDVGGIPEVLDDGVTGVLVPDGDPAALAGAIEELAGDADRRVRLGKAGRRRWSELFQHGAMVDAVEDVYGEARSRG